MNNSQLFQNTVEQHKGIFLKVARAYCLDEDDRQDLVQEMMIQVWHSFEKYNPELKISTWLYRIALNVAISFYRKNAPRKNKNTSLNKTVFQIQEEEIIPKEHEIGLLELFISELKEIDKALMLLYLEDKSHVEIGEILGLSVTNVATKVGRIKDRLKQRFSEQKTY